MSLSSVVWMYLVHKVAESCGFHKSEGSQDATSLFWKIFVGYKKDNIYRLIYSRHVVWEISASL